MRLIDGSFLEERCKRQMASEWNTQAKPQSWADAYEQFLTDIENCPTVDAVPVVRCKDCYACEKVSYCGGGQKRVCRLFDRQMQEDDFCSYGERRED